MKSEVELAKELARLKNIKDDLSLQLKGVNDQIDKAEGELIETLVEEGKNSTGHINGVGQFSLVRSIYPSIATADLPAFIESLRGTEDFGIVKETIAAPTLKKFLQDKIEELTNYYIENPQFCDGLSPADKAKEFWGKRGVKVFQDMRLQHRGRNKE